MAKSRVPFGIAFPIMIGLALVFLFTGTRLCGNVETGKDVRSALERGDTVPSNALPLDSAGNPRYQFECVTERRAKRFGWPYVLLGVGLLGWIFTGLGKDWLRKRKESDTLVSQPYPGSNGRWICPACARENIAGSTRCAQCGDPKPANMKPRP